MKILFIKYLGLILIIFAFLTSDFTMKFLTRNLAQTTRNITESFKKRGINEVEVKGKINLGIVSFEVSALDKKK